MAKRGFRHIRRRRRSGKRRGRRFVRRVGRIAKRAVTNLAETKFYTQSTSAIVPNSSFATYLSWMDGLTQGTGVNQRIGQNIRVKTLSMKIKVGLNKAGVSPGEYCNVRFLIFSPRRGHTTDDVEANYINSVSTPGLYGRPDPSAAIIWYDRFFRLSVTGTPGVGAEPSMRIVQWSKKLNRQFNFTGLTNMYQEPRIYIVTDKAPAIADSNVLTYYGYISVSFKDL